MTLFSEPVWGMSAVLKRVAIWTEHLKITKIVVFAITILVMYAKNFRMFAVSAADAFGQHAPRQHVFANCDELWFPFGFTGFVYTSSRTIFSLGGWRIQKRNSAVNTVVLHRAFFMHRLVIALRTAILRFVGTTRNVCKQTSAFRASRFGLCSSGKRHALSATILSSVPSVLGHCKSRLAMFANNRVSNSGACHATH